MMGIKGTVLTACAALVSGIKHVVPPLVLTKRSSTEPIAKESPSTVLTIIPTQLDLPGSHSRASHSRLEPLSRVRDREND